jgi:tetratricopeptide (TPR) repeat protein
MASIITIESPRRPIAHPGEEVEPGAVSWRIAALGSWIVALGAIRVAWAVVEYARDLRQGGTSGWELFFLEHPPAVALIGFWPLLLGLAIRRLRWPELLKAAALTLLILSVGGVTSALADWSERTSRYIAIGSFRIPRAALGRLGPFEMAAVLAGTAQLLVELVTAVRAIRLGLGVPEAVAVGDERRAAAGRAWLGWLAVCVSVAFLVLTVRVPSGSAALDLASRSRWVRDFILRDDFVRLRGPTRSAPRESAWAGEVGALLEEGREAWEAGRYAVAREAYARMAARLDAIPTATMTVADRGLAAQGLNNWAWLLATCPEAKLRDPQEGVRQARRALELAPNDGNTWNTLGVAYFRLGDWDEAQSALYRSMELRNEGDSNDWFFLAMIHWQRGRKERAREWFDKAAHWSRHNPHMDDELYRFEVEAAGALGLPKPEPRPPQATRAMSLPFPLRARGLRGSRPVPRPVDGWNRPR